MDAHYGDPNPNLENLEAIPSKKSILMVNKFIIVTIDLINK